VDIVQTAQRIADEVLFPAALATDASDLVPRELLDVLAGAGLYGLAAPCDAGGLAADFGTVCAVQEALAGGCLTTAFVWAQHLGLVRALAAGGDPELRARWLAPLARGEVRAGVAPAAASCWGRARWTRSSRHSGPSLTSWVPVPRPPARRPGSSRCGRPPP
jgi:alkylation response protein AidB-like acyl-CoA dehydrogenase